MNPFAHANYAVPSLLNDISKKHKQRNKSTHESISLSSFRITREELFSNFEQIKGIHNCKECCNRY